MPWWVALVLVVVEGVPQSNYDQQALSVQSEEGAGIPEFATLNGTVTELGKGTSPQKLTYMSAKVFSQAPFFWTAILRKETK